MRFRVHKLIRDRLPAMMRAQGLAVFERRLDDDEHLAALREKRVEEALEARDATDGDLVGELADVLEVVRALAEAHGSNHELDEQRRLETRNERGGFDDRVFNAAVEAEDGLPAGDYDLARPGHYPPDDGAP